jgi:hypothetical protein
MIPIHPDDFLRLVNDEREILVRTRAHHAGSTRADRHRWWHRFTR